MNLILLGNIIAFIGAIIMVLIGFIKTKKNILLAQNAQFIIMGIGNFLLGGVSGVIANAVSVLRNCVCLKWELTVPWKIFFVAIQVLLTWRTNTVGLIGWLPVFAAVIFTWFLDTKSEVLIKLLCVVGSAMWIIYDLYFLNYSASVFDALTILSNIAGIFMILRGKNAANTVITEEAAEAGKF